MRGFVLRSAWELESDCSWASARVFVLAVGEPVLVGCGVAVGKSKATVVGDGRGVGVAVASAPPHALVSRTPSAKMKGSTQSDRIGRILVRLSMKVNSLHSFTPKSRTIAQRQSRANHSYREASTCSSLARISGVQNARRSGGNSNR